MKVIHEKKLCFDYKKLFLVIICLFFGFTLLSLLFGSFLNLFWMFAFDRYDIDFIKIELMNMFYIISGFLIGVILGLNMNKTILYSEKIICREVKTK